MADIDVSGANILSERGVRYKRNTLAASLIATVLYLTNAPLGQVKIFGVGLSNVENQEVAAWTIFLAILGYQWIMLTYYGWRDWRIWQQRIRETFLLSGQNIAFWLIGAKVWDKSKSSFKIVSVDESHHTDLHWRSESEEGGGIGAAFSRSDRENIRWRLIAFLTIEFGLPFLWGLGCLCIAISKICA